MAITNTTGLKRYQFILCGQVQGVGLRPTVARIATILGYTGTIKNSNAGAIITVQGQNPHLFLEQLLNHLPPLAKVVQVQSESIAVDSMEQGFHILTSDHGHATRGSIPPDTATCKACLEELYHPQSHYYLYPFLNCTECGPRFSITSELPYDRSQTSMAVFPRCPSCAADYADPMNRRYHAQPIACTQCGPHLSIEVTAIAQAIQAGKIVAIKGLGGYQLWVDPTQAHAVERLRAHKQRAAKPFALMVDNLATAQEIALITPEEERQLLNPARPIVLLRRRPSKISIAEAVAPGLTHWGIMLPSTPIHELLFQTLQTLPVLLVTSGNLAETPLIYQETLANHQLATIADTIVHHNRAIVSPVDDSVLRVIAEKTVFIRRARGYVPEPIRLSQELPCTLALGGQQKNTFCLTRGQEAFVSQHIGNLTQAASIAAFESCLTHWQKLLDVKPERVVCDLHPDFYTTRLSHRYPLPVIRIQHHHAHLAAVTAEHHLSGNVLGLALDGYGYGEQGEAWGGELFILQDSACQRIGHLRPLPMVGGEIVVHQPWRMAAAVLQQLDRTALITHRFAQQPHAAAIMQLLKNNNTAFPLTSSAGRWFDAASALLNICPIAQYEGQAAAILESLVTNLQVVPNGWQIQANQLDILPIFATLLDCDPEEGANIFHGTLITALANWIQRAADHHNIKTIVLGGGCFVNHILLDGLQNMLTLCGLNVYWSHKVPVNDGGLSLGQAWAARNQNI